MSNTNENVEKNEFSNDEKEIQRFGGIVNPYLKYLYGFFNKYIIRKFGLRVEKDFWYFLSFGILTAILFFTGIPYWLPVLFLSLAGLDFIFHNGGFLKEKFWISPSKEIDSFFVDLEKKNQYQVIQFISNNRLSTYNLIRVLKEPRFNESSSIYTVILKKQWIHAELLEYIVDNNLFEKMGNDLLCGFIIKSVSEMNQSSYKKLMTLKGNDIQVVKTLHLCYPQYLKNHFIFKKFAWMPLKIKHSFTFGFGNLIIFTIFFGIYAFMFTTGQLRNLSTPTLDGITQLFQIFTIFVTIIFTSALLTIIFREIILLITQRRIFLYYFTPITTD